MTDSFGARFAVKRRLGEGGFGEVFEAFDKERGELVAIKQLARLDAPSLYRFKREFRIFVDLDHPGLVRLFELFSEGERWFFSMELVQGIDWRSYVRTDAGKPDLERVRSTLVQLLRALSALHDAGIVHRDVKPSNLLVEKGGRTVLLDFGIFLAVRDEARTATDPNAMIGTPAYMAPEQAAGAEISPAADLYAVGCMLFEALTGRLPFTGPLLTVLQRKLAEPAPRVRELADVPAPLDELCASLLAINPAERPTTAQVLSALGATSADAPVRETTSNVGAQMFVGREQSLSRLRKAFEHTLSGEPARVDVMGPSGMGKSAMIRAFLASLPDRVVRLEGKCFQRESVPYKAFDGVVVPGWALPPSGAQGSP